MPRILHLADIHLGRIFHGESLIDDQVNLLGQVAGLVEENPPDAVLLAGDLYDRALPPVEAVQLFDRFLTSLAETGTTVVAIPGNHDSAGRLNYASGAWERLGVHIRADCNRILDPVTVRCTDGTDLDIFALPYVEPAFLRELPGIRTDSGPSPNRSQLISAALDLIRDARTQERRAVLVAHEFVAGSIESGSERIYVGGSQSVPAEIFNGFDYVALGHIHGNQSTGDETIRYSGSPMAYSFDESGRPKGLLDVTLDSSALYPEIRFRELQPLRPLVILKDSLDGLLRNRAYEADRHSYISARVTDGLSHLNLIGRLRERFPYLRELRQVALEAAESGNPDTRRVSETPENVLSDFLDRAGWDEGNEREIAMSFLAQALDPAGAGT